MELAIPSNSESDPFDHCLVYGLSEFDSDFAHFDWRLVIETSAQCDFDMLDMSCSICDARVLTY